MSDEKTAPIVDLVDRKIAYYCSVGTTVASEPILSLLKSRSHGSLGKFETPEQAEQEEAERKRQESQTQPAEPPDPGEEENAIVQNGMVSGVAGRKLVVNGILDLRGVPTAQVEAIEKLVINGCVLVDEQNRAALSGIDLVVNGATMLVPPELRVLAQPDLEISRTTLDAMPPGQKMLLVGNVCFRLDVPPALIEEKFARLIVTGVVVMNEAVQGALLARAELHGVSIVIPSGITEVVRLVGDNIWTSEYLKRLPDHIAYIGVGNTTVRMA